MEFQDEEHRDNLLMIGETSPKKLLLGEKPILFDEWQDVPKLWGTIRKDVDDSGKKGQYILTGSSSKNIDPPSYRHTAHQPVEYVSHEPLGKRRVQW